MKKLLLVTLMFCGLFMAKAQTHWTPATGYESTMSVKGIIIIDGVEQASANLEIGAFCGDECRGAKKAALFPITNQYTVNISIAGNTGDLITFRIFDHSIGEELDLDSESTLTFEINAVIPPSGFNWYQIVFTTPSSGTTTNTSSGDWSDPSTWGGTEPTATANVQINTGDVTIGDNAAVEVTVASLEIVTGASLTIESGSTLIVTGNLVNDDEQGFIIEDGAQVINESAGVKATAHRNIQAYTQKDSNGWHLIASPVDKMEVAGSDFLEETYDLYRYDEPTAIWENYRTHYSTDFMIFENGRGYLYANSNSNFSPAFKGDLNYEPVTYQVKCESPEFLTGFNLIGNPFPHNIYKGAGGAIDDSKLASGYYTLSYYGEWVTHTFEDEIGPGQGILVKATTTGDITIGKTNAESTAETSAKNVSKRLKINVSGNGRSDRAYAYFSEGVGLNKMANYSSSAAQIAVKIDDNDYAIAHVGEDCEEMDVVFKNTKNGYYTVTLEGIEGFDYLHLIDLISGDDIDMLQEEKYRFHALGNEDENRFKIVCRDYTGIEENSENSAFSYISGNSIIVKGEGVLQIIDMTGRIVNTMNVNGVETIEKPSQNGVYVLRIVNGTDVKTQKIVVR